MPTVNPLGSLAGPSRRALDAPVRVGTAGGTARAAVDGAGAVSPDGSGWRLDWWVGADDRWHVPREEAAVRRRRIGGGPVVETAMRVPGGDAVARTFGIGGDPDGIVFEVENASAAPFALALVLGPAAGGASAEGPAGGASGAGRDSGGGDADGRGTRPSGGSLHRVSADGSRLDVDGSHRLLVARPPMRWASGRAGTSACRETVVGGAAFADGFGGRDGRVADDSGGLEVALLFPVAHRATFRCLVTPTPHGPRRGGSAEPGLGAGGVPPGPDDVPARFLAGLPSAADAARGWSTLLDRGMRAALPDDRTSELLSAARAAVLLDPSADAATMTVLEDWGFDTEAVEVWSRLGIRARRSARRRLPSPAAPEAALAAAVASASPMATWAAGPVPFLRALRDVLVDDRPGVAGSDGAVAVLPALPEPWVGAPLEVHDVPTRAGLVSYALRWHGGHPLLMWEVDPGPAASRSRVRSGSGPLLRAPALDPAWSTREPSGDVLLGHHHDHPEPGGEDPSA